MTTRPPTKAPEIQRWLKRHRRFTLHYTPAYSSWLNQVERWFSELTTKKLRRSTHRSVAELRRDINNWIEHWNANPRPFVWRKTADEILDNIATYIRRINDLTILGTLRPRTLRSVRRVFSARTREVQPLRRTWNGD